jgi:hypothetical protein
MDTPLLDVRGPDYAQSVLYFGGAPSGCGEE